MRRKSNADSNITDLILFRIVPYWPLFLLFFIFSVVGAVIYLRYAVKIYEATATLLIKDEKKGYDDSRIMESLNIYNSKKIVENEIEVIRSKSLMREVVKTLKLYAPIYEEGKIVSISAYTSSPVSIEAKDLDKIIESEDKVYFSFDYKANRVILGNKNYPVDTWLTSPWGFIRFVKNARVQKMADKPLYFQIISPKKIVNNLIKNINISTANKLASVVSLQIKDEIPEKAEDILNELINSYNRAGINDKNVLAVNTLQFVDDRLKVVESELDLVERQIQEYRAKEGVVNLSVQSSNFLKNVGENDQQISSISMKLAVLNEVEKYVASNKGKSGIVPSTLGVNDPVLTQMLQRLHSAEMEYEKLKLTTAEHNPILQSLKDEIERIRPNILENIRIEKISLNASRKNLNTTNEEYNEMLETFPEKERKLLEISRHQSTINNVYNFLLQKREETALTYAATMADIRVVDVAEASLKPVSPKKIIVLPAAAGFSMVISFLIICCIELFSNKILFRSEIEKITDVPVKGEISHVTNKEKLLVKDVSNSIFIEQFRQLAAASSLYDRNKSVKKVLVTSGVSGEGKSFVSANLAISLAESGKRVLLLDLDLRNPKLSRMLNFGTESGISEYVSGTSEVYEVIKESSYKNLYFIGSGNLPENSTQILSDEKLPQLFSSLEQEFDVIIADSPPIEYVSDAFILAPLCDLTLYVVRHRFTPKATLQYLDETIKIKSLKNTSIVFNGVKPRGIIKGKYGYGYGYGNEYLYINQAIEKSRQTV